MSKRPSTANALVLPPFGPVRTRRVFEDICDQIRGQVLGGVLRPGDKLPAERELAEQFGVSRTAVREALRSLEIAGVVKLQKGVKGGAFIQGGSPGVLTQSIRDMVALGRISLESLTEARLFICDIVVRLACQRGKEADFRALDDNIRLTEELERMQENLRRTEAVVDFYRLLANAAHNEVLSILMLSTAEIVRQVLARLAPAPSVGLFESRRRLVQYLRARDEEKAVAEITAHLKRIHRYILRQEKLKTI